MGKRPSLFFPLAAALLVAGCSTPRDYWGEGLLYDNYRIGQWDVTCSRFQRLMGDYDVEACRASRTVNGVEFFIERQPKFLDVTARYENCSTSSSYELPQPEFSDPATRGAELLAVVKKGLGEACNFPLDLASLGLNVADMDRFLVRTDDLRVLGKPRWRR